MGVITRVAGTGTAGNTGDDDPATEAELNQPCGVAVTADGGFLIADTSNHEVRKVSAAGVISRVAGTGTAGYTGDGGYATLAQLNTPYGVAPTADGGFLIADTFNSVVRMVSAAGVITTLAGTGKPGNAGDQPVPAQMAPLNQPCGVAATADGGFLIADTLNHQIRKVSSTEGFGMMTLVAGTGTQGNTGNDGPATGAELNTPPGVAVTADGGFLIADSFSSVVRKVAV